MVRPSVCNSKYGRDHNKYTKAVVSYLEEMRKLPDTAPEVQREFDLGSFSIKRSAGKFNNIWTDMALECSQNCDAKGRVGQAGLKGLTMKECTQEKWFLTPPFTAAVSSAIKGMVHVCQEDESHHEANFATKKRELESRERIVQTFSEGEMINPFTCNTTKDMLNIFDGQVATKEISRDLLAIRNKGRNLLECYIKTGTITKLKLHRFDDKKKGPKQDKPKQARQQMINEMSVLKRILIGKERGAEDTQLQDLLQHELHKYPPSIAEIDLATKNVRLRSGNKSVLLNIMKTSISLQEWPATISNGNDKSGVVVDVMGLIRTHKPFDNETNDSYANRLLLSAMQDTQCTEMHLVADRYDGLFAVKDAIGNCVSLKDASGCRDRRQEVKKEYQVNPGQIIKHWDDIIKCSKSKSNLLIFLYDSWSHSSQFLPYGLTLTLAGGFKDRQRVVTLRHQYMCDETLLVSEHDLLASTQEEADTRIFLHTAACVRKGCSRVVIRASETDIAVIAVYMCERLMDAGLKEIYIQTKDHYIPIHSIVSSFGIFEAKMLPLLHALSGCDTNSFFFGKGKRSFMKAAPKVAADLADICTQIEKESVICGKLIDRTITVATELLTKVYLHTHNFPNLCALRCHLYARKPDIKLLPPTDDAFRQHVLRAILQACIWVKAMQTEPKIPDPFKFGWISLPSGVQPVLMLKNPMPTNLMSNLFCNCKQQCKRNCSCQRRNIPCDITCSCKGESSMCVRVQPAFQEDENDTPD